MLSYAMTNTLTVATASVVYVVFFYALFRSLIIGTTCLCKTLPFCTLSINSRIKMFNSSPSNITIPARRTE